MDRAVEHSRLAHRLRGDGALLVTACNEENPGLAEPGVVAEMAIARAAAALPFRQISVGNAHTCAVTTGDKAYCRGDNSVGRSGWATPS